jgi:hypothetical protein
MRNIASALDQRVTLGVGHISYAQELPSSPSASIDEQRGTAQHQGTALVTVSKQGTARNTTHSHTTRSTSAKKITFLALVIFFWHFGVYSRLALQAGSTLFLALLALLALAKTPYMNQNREIANQRISESAHVDASLTRELHTRELPSSPSASIDEQRTARNTTHSLTCSHTTAQKPLKTQNFERLSFFLSGWGCTLDWLYRRIRYFFERFERFERLQKCPI